MENLLILFQDFIKYLYKSRYMIWTMAVNEIKKRYIGSLFGFLWAVINPLSQLAIYVIVFGVFFKSKPDPLYGTNSFFLYLLCGLIPWQFFVQTINKSANVLVSNSNLIKKAVGFPSEILPIITVISNIITHMIGVGLLLFILFMFTGRLRSQTLFIIIYLFFISVFAVGAGWIISSINVYLRDVQQVVGVIMMGLFFLTPIFYSPSIIPAQILPILKINPMYHVVDAYRLLILAGKFPPLRDSLYLVIISLLTFGIGGILFRKLKPGFAEVL